MCRTVGDLQVWWIPQVPMMPFVVDVKDVEQGVMIMNVLAGYDAFEFENKVKPDYCNAGGLRRWCDDGDGNGTPGWEDWIDDETGEEDPEEWLIQKKEENDA